MLILTVVIGGSVLSALVGIATGHLYFFLKDLAPVAYGWNVLKTPQFLSNWIDVPVRNPARASFTTLNNSNTGESASFRPGYSDGSGNTGNTGGSSGFQAFTGRGSSWG